VQGNYFVEPRVVHFHFLVLMESFRIHTSQNKALTTGFMKFLGYSNKISEIPTFYLLDLIVIGLLKYVIVYLSKLCSFVI